VKAFWFVQGNEQLPTTQIPSHNTTTVINCEKCQYLLKIQTTAVSVTALNAIHQSLPSHSPVGSRHAKVTPNNTKTCCWSTSLLEAMVSTLNMVISFMLASEHNRPMFLRKDVVS